jgi:hypothetical protein
MHCDNEILVKGHDVLSQKLAFEGHDVLNHNHHMKKGHDVLSSSKYLHDRIIKSGCDKKQEIGLQTRIKAVNATQSILGVSTRTCAPGNR